MLRHYDQHGGGVRVYTQHMVQTLLSLDSEHEFVLLYRNPELLGTHVSPKRIVTYRDGGASDAHGYRVEDR